MYKKSLVPLRVPWVGETFQDMTRVSSKESRPGASSLQTQCPLSSSEISYTLPNCSRSHSSSKSSGFLISKVCNKMKYLSVSSQFAITYSTVSLLNGIIYKRERERENWICTMTFLPWSNQESESNLEHSQHTSFVVQGGNL